SVEFTLEVCDACNACGSDTVTWDVPFAFYVARPPIGDDDMGLGTPSDPWATVTKGIAEADAALTAGGNTGTAVVFVGGGIYPESVVMADGVSVWGGHDAENGWTRDLVANFTALSGNAPTVTWADGNGYTRTSELDGMNVEPTTPVAITAIAESVRV